MERLRKEIIKINKFNVSYYNSLLDIIDDYQEEKPDITIETCKALLEGISKLILHIIRQEPIHELDKSNNLQDIFKSALTELNNKHDYFNDEFVKRTASLIHLLGEIRNKQGDICHGRTSLKQQKNCQDFAEMVSIITESLAIYMLRKFDEVSETPLRYDDFKEYNDYLDLSIENFPIQTEKFSKILFEYDKDVYYSRYVDEFILIKDNEKNEINFPDFEKHLIEEIKFDEIESKFFNSEKHKKTIYDFALKENLHLSKLTIFLDDYFFTNEMPPRVKIIDLIKSPYSELNENSKVNNLKRKLNNLINSLI